MAGTFSEISYFCKIIVHLWDDKWGQLKEFLWSFLKINSKSATKNLKFLRWFYISSRATCSVVCIMFVTWEVWFVCPWETVYDSKKNFFFQSSRFLQCLEDTRKDEGIHSNWQLSSNSG